MADIAEYKLKAGANPQFLLAHLGINAENGYGYRTEEDGTTTIVVRAEDFERLVEAADDYDRLYLDGKLRPEKKERVWQLRKQNMSRMKVAPGQYMDLDDVTISRLHQAKDLVEEAEKRGQAFTQLDWEYVKFSFVHWPTQVVKDMAYNSGRHIQLTFTHQSGLYDALDAAETKEELDAIDVENGWPNQ